MKTKRRCLSLVLLALMTASVPVHAQGSGSHGKSPISWQQRDTAVYVVSTLNLLGRTRTHTVQQLLQRLKITRVEVYADGAQANLFFIDLKRDDGTVAGSLAYQLGWPKPKRISWTAGKSIPAAATATVDAYRNDDKTLIGTFTPALTPCFSGGGVDRCA